jgi:uncharacterized protein YdeI (YjbR/CyaY-like superfamily)
MVKTENFEQVEISSQNELRDWLMVNHSQGKSVWLVTYKKEVPVKYVSTGEVLDELLCFGWIDGIRRKLDDSRTMQLISPRKTQHWTETYKKRYSKLMAGNLVHQAGIDAVEQSKRLGLWDFMEDVDKLIQPEDFKLAMKEHPGAEQNFNAFAPSAQRFTLRWIKLSKTAETRNKRISIAAALASVGKKIPGL